MNPSPEPTMQSVPAQEAGTRPSPSGPVPAGNVAEFPGVELAVGAAALAAAWVLRRRGDRAGD